MTSGSGSSSPIFVTGGTGGIGAPLVRSLMSSGAIVRVLTRDPVGARSILGADAILVEGNLGDVEAIAAGAAGCQRVFFLSPTGPRMGEDAAAFAKIVRSVGISHVVAVSSGTIELSPPVALGQWHRAIEDALTASGLATTFLRPDNIASNALRWAGMIRGTGTVFTVSADSLSVPVDPRDIAAVAHVALTQPGHAGEIYTLSGPAVLSMREQVAILGKEIGRSLRVVEVPADRARAGMVDNGMPVDVADAIIEVMGQPPRPTTTVGDVTGQPPREFADWVRANREAFL